MYNLIIVDDEEIVLNSIQKVFEMEKYKFKIVATFTDPRKALEEVKELSPQLIITDIKMPHMDGLEFSKKIKEILPQVEIVVLSGHDDFVFAQTAMKLGVSDYLLKPIRKKDFDTMLHNMYKKIEAVLSWDQQFKILSKATMSNYSILRNKFFSILMDKGNSKDPIITKLYDELGLCFAEYNFVLVKYTIGEVSIEDDYISKINKFIDEFKDYIKGYGFIEEFYTDEYLYFYIYDLDTDDFIKENFVQAVLDYAKKKNCNGSNIRVGISQIHSSMSNLFFAVCECDEFILNSETNLVSEKLPMNSLLSMDANLYFPYSEIESLFVAIFSNNKENITSAIENILNLPTTSVYNDFSYSIAIIIMIRMCQIQDKYNAKYQHITKDLLKIERLKQLYPATIRLKQLLLDKSMVLADLINSQSVAAPSKTILAAVKYIESNFNKNISLSDVAEHIYISKNYLCDLFKKELNITFIDYVTNLRIEKSKYYLSNTDMKMYEISSAVGYNDYAYFSQIFKRHTGVSLSNYRKQN